MTRRRSLLALAAAALCTACSSPPASASGSLVDLQIVDRSRGDELAAYPYRGSTYVAGRPGDRYAVRLVNRSAGRVLVVLSVDGVNAISGETAAVGQTGYVLAPYGSAEITGWRKSESEAAAFYFTSLPDSYAARTDRPGNVGVIGAAVFRERVAPPPAAVPYSFDRSERREAGRLRAPSSENEAPGGAQPDAAARSAAPPPVAASPLAASPRAAAPPMEARDESRRERAQDDKLGTGHGEREYSPTWQTQFERATRQPSEIVQVRYDSYRNLVAAGIVDRPYASSRPQPFPRFAPDPR